MARRAVLLTDDKADRFHGRPAPTGRAGGARGGGNATHRARRRHMETTMTRKIRRPNAPATAIAKKAETGTARATRRPQTKKQIGIALLERPKGASIAEMQRAMGWQGHSVRGFLAATVKKMHGVTLTSEKPDDGPRRYRVVRAEG